MTYVEYSIETKHTPTHELMVGSDRRVDQLKEDDVLFPNMVPEWPCAWYAEVLQTVEGTVPYDVGDWELTNEVSQSGVLNEKPKTYK